MPYYANCIHLTRPPLLFPDLNIDSERMMGCHKLGTHFQIIFFGNFGALINKYNNSIGILNYEWECGVLVVFQCELTLNLLWSGCSIPPQIF